MTNHAEHVRACFKSAGVDKDNDWVPNDEGVTLAAWHDICAQVDTCLTAKYGKAITCAKSNADATHTKTLGASVTTIALCLATLPEDNEDI